MKPKLINKYFYVWALCIPATSFLVFPNVQGTTPAFLLAICSLAIPFLYLFKYNTDFQFRDLLILFGIWALFTCISQLSISVVGEIDFKNANLVNEEDPSTSLLRTTLFTQSLYLFCAFALFVYVKNYYNSDWDKYLLIGATLFVIYGLYEFVFFLITGQNGDFVANRNFRNTSGSMFQGSNFAGISFMRIKSMAGEPSMYSYTVLPYWIYSMHKKKIFLSVLIFITLILTVSSTAILGVGIYFIYYFTVRRYIKVYQLIISFVLGLLAVFNYPILFSYFDQYVISKLTLNSFSGQERFESFMASLTMFNDLNVVNQLFGVGFGYIRSTDLLSTLLVNIGIIGLIMYVLLFLYPVFLLRNNDRNYCLKAILIVVLSTSMISVPEFSILPAWAFLGMAYKELKSQRSTIQRLN